MAMTAHGYGIAAVGTPNIIFSNVLWGHLVRLIPTVGGIDGYSIATLSVLVIVGATLIYAFLRLRLGVIACAAVVSMTLVRAVLFPQFTVNAGLLVVAAVVCWLIYARTGEKRALVAGYLLAYLGYLVRVQEFALVLLVAVPILPWRALLSNKTGKLAVAFFAVALVSAAIIDQRAYDTPEWRSFYELNTARAPLTDFGAGAVLKQHPEILKQHGYSTNDVNLMVHWFFADPRLANPLVLSEMRQEVGLVPAVNGVNGDIRNGINELWTRYLLPLVCAALLLALCYPNWRLAASWGLFLVAVVGMAVIGRPGVLRVYVAPICLLLIAPFFLGDNSVPRRFIAMSLVLIAAVTNIYNVTPAWQVKHRESEAIVRAFIGFPTTPVVIWGSAFPFMQLYPVLGASSDARSYSLYGLGVFTWAPFSTAYMQQSSGHGLIARLSSTEGVAIIATGYEIGYLKIYCQEHLQGHLEELGSRHYDGTLLRQERCVTSP